MWIKWVNDHGIPAEYSQRLTSVHISFCRWRLFIYDILRCISATTRRTVSYFMNFKVSANLLPCEKLCLFYIMLIHYYATCRSSFRIWFAQISGTCEDALSKSWKEKDWVWDVWEGFESEAGYMSVIIKGHKYVALANTGMWGQILA